MELFAGVVDDEAEGVTAADAGVKVRGSFVRVCCLKAD